jgi:anti-sigma B factor antagonist
MISKVIKDNKMLLYLDDDLIANKVKELIPTTKQLLTSETNFDEVILNLEKVKIVDSIGISFVIGLYKTTLSMKIKFRIAGINNDIKDIFELMKLNNLFEF